MYLPMSCTYAAEFSRGLEPSKEQGSRVWDVLSSCVFLYKRGEDCSTAPHSACCSADDKEIFANVWSLASADGSNILLTSNVSERRSLLGTYTSNWHEECRPVSEPTVFCHSGSVLDGRPGPFMLYSVPTAIQLLHHEPNGTRPLYRCVAHGLSNSANAGGAAAPPGRFFLSTARGCEGFGTRQATISHVAVARGSEMLRALWRCAHEAGGPPVRPR